MIVTHYSVGEGQDLSSLESSPFAAVIGPILKLIHFGIVNDGLVLIGPLEVLLGLLTS